MNQVPPPSSGCVFLGSSNDDMTLMKVVWYEGAKVAPGVMNPGMSTPTRTSAPLRFWNAPLALSSSGKLFVAPYHSQFGVSFPQIPKILQPGLKTKVSPISGYK